MGSPAWAVAIRVAALLVLLFLFAIPLSEIEDAVMDRAAPGAVRALSAIAASLAVGVGVLVALRLVRPRAAGRGWSGFPRRPGARGRLLAGAALGAVMLGAVAGLGLAAGLWRVERVATIGAEAVAIFALGVVAALVGALLEEGVFRGSLYSEARARAGFWPSTILVSVPFALLHAQGTGFGAQYALAATAVSVFLLATREVTGDLWFALGWHAAWNAMQFSVLGIAVAEAPHDGHALVQMERVGADLWLGRGTSIEGGLLAGGALALAMAAALALRRGRPATA